MIKNINKQEYNELLQSHYDWLQNPGLCNYVPFHELTLPNMKFEKDRLHMATFNICRFIGCTFTNVDFSDSCFIGVEFSHCVFIKCNFTNAQIQMSKFIHCEFKPSFFILTLFLKVHYCTCKSIYPFFISFEKLIYLFR